MHNSSEQNPLNHEDYNKFAQLQEIKREQQQEDPFNLESDRNKLTLLGVKYQKAYELTQSFLDLKQDEYIKLENPNNQRLLNLALKLQSPELWKELPIKDQKIILQLIPVCLELENRKRDLTSIQFDLLYNSVETASSFLIYNSNNPATTTAGVIALMLANLFKENVRPYFVGDTQSVQITANLLKNFSETIFSDNTVEKLILSIPHTQDVQNYIFSEKINREIEATQVQLKQLASANDQQMQNVENIKHALSEQKTDESQTTSQTEKHSKNQTTESIAAGDKSTTIAQSKPIFTDQFLEGICIVANHAQQVIQNVTDAKQFEQKKEQITAAIQNQLDKRDLALDSKAFVNALAEKRSIDNIQKEFVKIAKEQIIQKVGNIQKLLSTAKTSYAEAEENLKKIKHLNILGKEEINEREKRLRAIQKAIKNTSYDKVLPHVGSCLQLGASLSPDLATKATFSIAAFATNLISGNDRERAQRKLAKLQGSAEQTQQQIHHFDHYIETLKNDARFHEALKEKTLMFGIEHGTVDRRIQDYHLAIQDKEHNIEDMKKIKDEINAKQKELEGKLTLAEKKVKKTKKKKSTSSKKIKAETLYSDLKTKQTILHSNSDTLERELIETEKTKIYLKEQLENEKSLEPYTRILESYEQKLMNKFEKMGEEGRKEYLTQLKIKTVIAQSIEKSKENKLAELQDVSSGFSAASGFIHHTTSLTIGIILLFNRNAKVQEAQQAISVITTVLDLAAETPKILAAFEQIKTTYSLLSTFIGQGQSLLNFGITNLVNGMINPVTTMLALVGQVLKVLLPKIFQLFKIEVSFDSKEPLDKVLFEKLDKETKKIHQQLAALRSQSEDIGEILKETQELVVRNLGVTERMEQRLVPQVASIVETMFKEKESLITDKIYEMRYRIELCKPSELEMLELHKYLKISIEEICEKKYSALSSRDALTGMLMINNPMDSASIIIQEFLSNENLTNELKTSGKYPRIIRLEKNKSLKLPNYRILNKLIQLTLLHYTSTIQNNFSWFAKKDKINVTMSMFTTIQTALETFYEFLQLIKKEDGWLKNLVNKINSAYENLEKDLKLTEFNHFLETHYRESQEKNTMNYKNIYFESCESKIKELYDNKNKKIEELLLSFGAPIAGIEKFKKYITSFQSKNTSELELLKLYGKKLCESHPHLTAWHYTLQKPQQEKKLIPWQSFYSGMLCSNTINSFSKEALSSDLQNYFEFINTEMQRHKNSTNLLAESYCYIEKLKSEGLLICDFYGRQLPLFFPKELFQSIHKDEYIALLLKAQKLQIGIIVIHYRFIQDLTGNFYYLSLIYSFRKNLDVKEGRIYPYKEFIIASVDHITVESFFRMDYELSDMNNDKLEDGKLYTKTNDNKLQYKVKNPLGEPAEGSITEEELQYRIQANAPLNTHFKYLKNILRITSARGHTSKFTEVESLDAFLITFTLGEMISPYLGLPSLGSNNLHEHDQNNSGKFHFYYNLIPFFGLYSFFRRGPNKLFKFHYKAWNNHAKSNLKQYIENGKETNFNFYFYEERHDGTYFPNYKNVEIIYQNEVASIWSRFKGQVVHHLIDHHWQVIFSSYEILIATIILTSGLQYDAVASQVHKYFKIQHPMLLKELYLRDFMKFQEVLKYQIKYLNENNQVSLQQLTSSISASAVPWHKTLNKQLSYIKSILMDLKKFRESTTDISSSQQSKNKEEKERCLTHLSTLSQNNCTSALVEKDNTTLAYLPGAMMIKDEKYSLTVSWNDAGEKFEKNFSEDETQEIRELQLLPIPKQQSFDSNLIEKIKSKLAFKFINEELSDLFEEDQTREQNVQTVYKDLSDITNLSILPDPIFLENPVKNTLIKIRPENIELKLLLRSENLLNTKEPLIVSFQDGLFTINFDKFNEKLKIRHQRKIKKNQSAQEVGVHFIPPVNFNVLPLSIALTIVDKMHLTIEAGETSLNKNYVFPFYFGLNWHIFLFHGDIKDSIFHLHYIGHENSNAIEQLKTFFFQCFCRQLLNIMKEENYYSKIKKSFDEKFNMQVDSDYDIAKKIVEKFPDFHEVTERLHHKFNFGELNLHTSSFFGKSIAYASYKKIYERLKLEIEKIKISTSFMNQKFYLVNHEFLLKNKRANEVSSFVIHALNTMRIKDIFSLYRHATQTKLEDINLQHYLFKRLTEHNSEFTKYHDTYRSARAKEIDGINKQLTKFSKKLSPEDLSLYFENYPELCEFYVENVSEQLDKKLIDIGRNKQIHFENINIFNCRETAILKGYCHGDTAVSYFKKDPSSKTDFAVLFTTNTSSGGTEGTARRKIISAKLQNISEQERKELAPEIARIFLDNYEEFSEEVDRFGTLKNLIHLLSSPNDTQNSSTSAVASTNKNYFNYYENRIKLITHCEREDVFKFYLELFENNLPLGFKGASLYAKLIHQSLSVWLLRENNLLALLDYTKHSNTDMLHVLLPDPTSCNNFAILKSLSHDIKVSPTINQSVFNIFLEWIVQSHTAVPLLQKDPINSYAFINHSVLNIFLEWIVQSHAAIPSTQKDLVNSTVFINYNVFCIFLEWKKEYTLPATRTVAQAMPETAASLTPTTTTTTTAIIDTALNQSTFVSKQGQQSLACVNYTFYSFFKSSREKHISPLVHTTTAAAPPAPETTASLAPTTTTSTIATTLMNNISG